MDNQLEGIALSGYRSFGAEMQYFYPLHKMNIVIGPNNCGKSNLLRFIHNHLSLACQSIRKGQTTTAFDAILDRHTYQSQTLPIKVRLKPSLDRDSSLAVYLRSNARDNAKLWVKQIIEKLPGFSYRDTKTVWVGAELNPAYNNGLTDDYVEEVFRNPFLSELEMEPVHFNKALHSFVYELTKQQISDAKARFKKFHQLLNCSVDIVPESTYIPAVRHLLKDGADPDTTYNGFGIIERLDRM